MGQNQNSDDVPDAVIRLRLQVRRHAKALLYGEKLPTKEEKEREIRAGQRKLATKARRTFGPDLTVSGFEGTEEVIVEIRGPKRQEICRDIQSKLDCVADHDGRSRSDPR